jgi:hypothetical protein
LLDCCFTALLLLHCFTAAKAPCCQRINADCFTASLLLYCCLTALLLPKLLVASASTPIALLLLYCFTAAKTTCCQRINANLADTIRR